MEGAEAMQELKRGKLEKKGRKVRREGRERVRRGGSRREGRRGRGKVC